jgi:hypothetical protein
MKFGIRFHTKNRSENLIFIRVYTAIMGLG